MVINNMIGINARFVIVVSFATLVIPPTVYGQSAGGEAITISRSDFLLAPEDVMESIASLESLAKTSANTAEYARAYDELQQKLTKVRPPVSEWNETNRDRLRELPEPTETAWAALDAEKQRVQERRRAQAQASLEQRELALDRQRDNAREQAREEQSRRAAELQAARIEELEARADYYDRSNRFYNNWWWTGGHNHHQKPHFPGHSNGHHNHGSDDNHHEPGSDRQHPRSWFLN